jgi:hypothetical protein
MSNSHALAGASPGWFRFSQRFYNLWIVRNDRAVRLEVHRTQDAAHAQS